MLDPYRPMPQNPVNSESDNVALLDVGNTAIKLGFADGDTGDVRGCHTVVSASDCRDKLETMGGGTLYYSSVRSGFDPQSACPLSGWEIMSAKESVNSCGIEFLPNLDVGVDRKVACVAARTKHGEPVLVITAGTATTVSAVNSGRCDFAVIWPGLEVSLKAITESTHISTPDLFPTTATLTDVTSLTESVTIGVLSSTVAVIERWVAHFENLWGTRPALVVAGGYAEPISAHLETEHHLESYLVIEGLAMMATGALG